MNKNYQIDLRHSAGNLHVDVKGVFNAMCAWELVKQIKNTYTGFGRVFMKTSGLKKLDEKGIELFKSMMKETIMPMEDFYIKGKVGFKIGPNGSRVIICKKNCNHKPLKPQFPMVLK